MALPDADALEVEVELADEVADNVAVDELVLDDEGLLEADDDEVDELVADEVELPLDVALVDAVGEDGADPEAVAEPEDVALDEEDAVAVDELEDVADDVDDWLDVELPD